MTENADTRTRIQQTAMRLFIEQGYEATSLREIAEELGVTKAALYYHFKTKEDIVASMAERRLANMSALLDWGKAAPPTPETRRELLRRYSEDLFTSCNQEILRFSERNQTALRTHPTFVALRETTVAMAKLLSDPEDPATVRIKNAMALFAIHGGAWLLSDDPRFTEQECRDAALEVALDLITPG
ncbi:TetR/AcrR family transcriptional regulator [Sinosporangium siamense]|uniref:TetR family transcriptional regulator n=1 Tax=Sinosporangium siamense TaxID=1367973 RepID=A0A919RMS5_9ACTN|nr:TetR/AcrR family transcriptional regulator [Sinosporangium siamense]GII96652.1 TetR family transcriptional regulator [Sinosporangium siamense]